MNRPAVPILIWAGLQFLFGVILLVWQQGGTPWLMLMAGGVLAAAFALFVDPPAWLVHPSAKQSGAVLGAVAFAAILTGLFAGAWLVILGGLLAATSVVLLVAEARNPG